MIDMKALESIENLSFEIEDYVEIEVSRTTDYEELINKPAIDNVELYKNTKLVDIGIETATNTEINELFK